MNNQIILQKIDELAPRFNELAKSHGAVDFTTECMFAKQALQNNEYLMKIAIANPQSLFDAILNVASIGLTLNPIQKRAYLIPRKTKICLDPSYVGLAHVAQESGSVIFAQAQCVYSNDKFSMPTIGEKPTHEFNPFLKREERGSFIGVYCVAKIQSGDYLTQVMSAEQVYEIRDRSDGWASFKNKGTKTPWVTDFEEMAKKTVIKQASKMWPKNTRIKALDEVVQIDHDNQKMDADEIFDLDIQKKQESIEEIRKKLGTICEKMDNAQKGQFLIKELKINKFDDLKRKTQFELDGISLKLDEKIREKNLIEGIPL